ncbi:MAG: hypothetical protein M0C28_44485 [Candidatus Moduliflexus flocculans]|nr:hypothetical protein [Candidatus Moduliflexus flocculans]
MDEIASHIAAEGTGIAIDCAAYRAGDGRRPFESCQTFGCTTIGKITEDDSRSSRNRRLVAGMEFDPFARLRTTTPRTPLSLTSTFEPPPSKVKGISCFHNNLTMRASSADVSAVSKTSAGPPIRAEVYGARETFSFTLSPSLAYNTSIGRSATAISDLFFFST